MLKNKRTLVIIVGVLLLACCGLTGLSALFSGGDSAETESRFAEADGVEEVAISAEGEDTAEAEQSAESELAEDPTTVAEPTDAPTSTPAPTATPPSPGFGRNNPLPVTEAAVAPNWQVQVIETLRGDEAWQQIQAANQFNDPPSEGNQYILVKVAVENISDQEESLRISGSDFRLTGDRLIEYSSASIVEPEPKLDAELFSGGSTEGWIAFEVGADEGNLILIVDELWNFDDERYRYIALDEGAAIQVDPALNDIQPIESGLSRVEPVPLGTTAVTEDWEITISEVKRGDEAWQMAQSANSLNDAPADGMEYVAFYVTARLLSTQDAAVTIDGSFFQVTGSSHLVHETPFVVESEPRLDARLFPGGQIEGWVFEQAQVGETDLMAVFSPIFSFTDEETRFLALEEGASIAMPGDLNSEASAEVGDDRANPAKVGEPVLAGDWEVAILEVLRGQEAIDRVLAENQFNDPPEAGMTYIAVKIAAHSLHEVEETRFISQFDFNLVGDSGVIFDLPSVVAPFPELDFSHFPDARSEGWIVLEAPADETGLLLEFDPSLLGSPRYLALE